MKHLCLLLISLTLFAAAGDNFGYSVAISGNRVVVGAYRDDDGITDSGASYIFKANGAAGVLPGMMMYLLQ